MTNNVEALRTLYVALGGEASDVENASTIVEVLNAIAVLFEGDGDAALNAEAIANIAAVASSIYPSPATLIEKEITENGTYNASSDEADGYSKVTVSVPNPSTGKLTINSTEEVNCTNYASAQVVDEYLVAENIKNGVTILGITGSYTG